MVLLCVILCDHEEKSFIRCEIKWANTNFIEEKTKCCTYVRTRACTHAGERTVQQRQFRYSRKSENIPEHIQYWKKKGTQYGCIHTWAQTFFQRGEEWLKHCSTLKNGFWGRDTFCLLKGRGRGGERGGTKQKIPRKSCYSGGKERENFVLFQKYCMFHSSLKTASRGKNRKKE